MKGLKKFQRIRNRSEMLKEALNARKVINISCASRRLSGSLGCFLFCGKILQEDRFLSFQGRLDFSGSMIRGSP